MPESGPELTESGPGCGPNSPESFAWFDRNTCSWRMSQRLLFEGFPEFLGTWPRSGSMRNGIAFPLRPLVPRIDAGGSLSLPTPRANERGQYQRDGGQKGKERLTLTGLAAQGLLPTPSATDGERGGVITPGMTGMSLPQFVNTYLPTPTATVGSHGGRITPKKGRRGGNLIEALSQIMYPTLRADGRDNAGGTNSRRTAKANGTYFGRTLNPQFVEWLMGFPLGWTDLEGSATP